MGRVGLTVCGCCFRETTATSYSEQLARIGGNGMQGRLWALSHHPEENHSFKELETQRREAGV